MSSSPSPVRSSPIRSTGPPMSDLTEDPHPPPTLSNLPHELLTLLATFLPLPDLIHLSSTSRHYRQTLKTKSFGKQYLRAQRPILKTNLSLFTAISQPDQFQFGIDEQQSVFVHHYRPWSSSMIYKFQILDSGRFKTVVTDLEGPIWCEQLGTDGNEVLIAKLQQFSFDDAYIPTEREDLHNPATINSEQTDSCTHRLSCALCNFIKPQNILSVINKNYRAFFKNWADDIRIHDPLKGNTCMIHLENRDEPKWNELNEFEGGYCVRLTSVEVAGVRLRGNEEVVLMERFFRDGG